MPIFKNRKLISTQPIDTLPIGTIQATISDIAPSGYLMLRGQQERIARYPELAQMCGSLFNYGRTPDVGYFYLPDMRGKVIVGFSNDDVEFNTIGKLFGSKVHTLTEAQLPNISGSINIHAKENGSIFYDPTGIINGTQVNGSYQVSTPTSGSRSINSIMNIGFGSGQSHNNIQPSISLNYMVKADILVDVEINNIVDNLTSEEQTKALSANQGKILKDAIDEVFISVSNGKTLVAEAITDKGVTTSPTATFQTMADNISDIQSGSRGNDKKTGFFPLGVNKNSIVTFLESNLKLFPSSMSYNGYDNVFASTDSLIAYQNGSTSIRIANVKNNKELVVSSIIGAYSFKEYIILVPYYTTPPVNRTLYLISTDTNGNIVKKDLTFSVGTAHNDFRYLWFHGNYIIYGPELNSSGASFTRFHIFEYDSETKEIIFLRSIQSSVRARITGQYNEMTSDRKLAILYNTTQSGYSKTYNFIQFNEDFTSVTVSVDISSPTSLSPSASSILKTIDGVTYMCINEGGTTLRVCTVDFSTNVITTLYTINMSSHTGNLIMGKSCYVYQKATNTLAYYDIIERVEKFVTQQTALYNNLSRVATHFNKANITINANYILTQSGLITCDNDNNVYMNEDVPYKEFAMLFLSRLGCSYSGSGSIYYNYYSYFKDSFIDTNLNNIGIATRDYIASEIDTLDIFNKSKED